jgi:hypothetical protein
MKVKTNMRAGGGGRCAGGGGAGGGSTNSGGVNGGHSANDVPPVYVPPVSRCVGA